MLIDLIYYIYMRCLDLEYYALGAQCEMGRCWWARRSEEINSRYRSGTVLYQLSLFEVRREVFEENL